VTWQNGSPKTENPYRNNGSENLQKTPLFFCIISITSCPTLHRVVTSSKGKGESSVQGQTCYCSAKLLNWQDLNFSLGAGLYWGLFSG